MTSTMDAPAPVVARLNKIEQDLAVKQNAWESAALEWFRKKRDREHDWAVAYMKAEGSVEARKAQASIQTANVGKEEEALYEALKAVVRVLETRATIGMSLLRSQGRG